MLILDLWGISFHAVVVLRARKPYNDETRRFRMLQDVQTIKDAPKAIPRSFFRLWCKVKQRRTMRAHAIL